jgi:AraC family transcriptional regulator
MPSAQSWTSALWGVEALRARLVYYPPGLAHAAHSHDAPHVSVVVAGSFRETTPRGEQIVCHGSIGFRADEARHSVRFGPAGALILTVALDEWIGEGVPRAGVRWVGASEPFARELLLLARRGGAQECDELADRLVALWTARPRPDSSGSRTPPAWLRDAAEQLLSAPEVPIATLAARLGVHRVHLARSFVGHYGMAPSVFRRRAMASHAVSAALGGIRLADAAAEAGFADQSHMSRVLREYCGVSAGELRRLFVREATSVQAGAAAIA